MRLTRWIAVVSIGFMMAGHVYAQDKKVQESYESLKKRSNSRDAQRLLTEAERLKTKDPKRALDNVQEALAMSLADGDTFYEGKSYLLLGQINADIEEWELALENYLRAYPKLVGTKSSTEFQQCLNGLGKATLKLGQYPEALTYYQELLELKQSNKNECRLSISEVYYEMKDYAVALKTLSEIKYAAKISGGSFETRLQNQKAKIYARMNELEKTQAIYSNSLEGQRANTVVGAQDRESTQQAKEEISDVLTEQKRYDEEINLRKQSIAYNTESKDFAEVTKDKVAISKTLEVKGELPAALKEAEEAATIADSLNNPSAQAHAYLSLADLYEKNYKNTQALSAYKKYSDAITRKEQQNENRLLEKSELIKKQKNIEELTKNVSISKHEETIANQTVFRQQLIIYGLLALILTVGIASYFTYRSAQASKIANQLLALKSLRSQMNPHFIFNALNSVNHFVAQQDERTANKFLSEFSQLMRLVLENSQEDFIPLFKEQEILNLYLKLEHYRFRDKFEYEINIDENISNESIEVPPMLIQPYIENAVWHGLRYKETKGKLTLNISQTTDFLLVEITDNGIGRKKSVALKTANQRKHTSTGLKNIQERLLIINKVYKTNYRVIIEDLPDDSGTRVCLYLPITKTAAA